MKTVMDIYGSLNNVKILTLAPEKDSSGQIIRTLTDMGITVACGHSMGNLKDGENAVQNGASLITHLFNAMLPVSYCSIKKMNKRKYITVYIKILNYF